MAVFGVFLRAHHRDAHAGDPVEQPIESGSELDRRGDRVVSHVAFIVVEVRCVGTTAQLLTEEHISDLLLS